MNQLWKGVRTHPRGLAAALLLLAAVVGSAALAVWALQVKNQAQAAVQQAAEEREQARKSVADSQEQIDQALAARQITAKGRDQALAAMKSAQQSEQDAKAVLAFFQNNVLSVGRPKGWAGGEWAGDQRKNVTLRQAVDTAEADVAKTFADRPLAEASVRETLGSTYLDLGEAARAVQQLERALTLREAMLGPDDPATGDCRNKLAVAYRLAGRPDEAGLLFKHDSLSSSHAAALAVRGAMLLSQKDPVEAELKLRECLAIRQKLQPDDWPTFDAKSMLGEALVEQKKYAEAEPLLLSGYEGLKQRVAKIPSQDKARLTKALERLVRLYEAWGKKDKAARWQKELETAQAAKKT